MLLFVDQNVCVDELVISAAVKVRVKLVAKTLGAPELAGGTENGNCAESSAVRSAACVGLKLTLIVQIPFGAREPVQALLCAYSEGLAPVNVIVGALSEVVLTLVIVTVCALLVVPVRWLPNERLVGLTLSPAPASTVVVALGLPPGPVQVSV